MEKIKEMTKIFHAISLEEWKSVIKFYEKHPDYMMFPLNINRDTVFHLAMYSKKKEPFNQLQNFFKNYTKCEDKDVFFSRNEKGNTILHEAVAVGNLEVIKLLVRDYRELIEEKNTLDENALYSAAAFGQTEIIKFFIESYGKKRFLEIMSEGERRKIDGKSIIQVAIEGEHFETALKFVNLLVEMNETHRIRRLKDKKGMSALDCLANLPSAFRSGHTMGLFESFIYSYLPVQDDIKDACPSKDVATINADSSQLSSTQDIDLENCRNSSSRHEVLDGIKQSIWKFIQGWQVEKIWKQKRKHYFALQLASLLIKETIWGDEFSGVSSENMGHITSEDEVEADIGEVEESETERSPTKDMDSSSSKDQDAQIKINKIEHAKQSSEEDGPKENPSTEMEIKGNSESEEDDLVGHNSKGDPSQTTSTALMPLFSATKMGIIEIVGEIIKEYPQAIEHLNSRGQNILHVAVSYRRRAIFSLLKKMKIPWTRMTQVIDIGGYTLLHQIADTRHYTGGTRPGPALQLQEELLWFDRVERVVPSYYAMHHENKKNQTPNELFEEKHKKQLEEAQKWAKETSQSCSTVAVLVATVVFAAAYTVPGGTDKKGFPNFLNSPYFLFFTIMDVISLASSLTSVVAFLSILTSPFEFHDFRRSIPRKLILGFTLLFFSVITTMLAFGSTILLVIRKKKQLTASLISVAAFVPVSVFAILQFRLYGTMIKDLLSIITKPFPCLKILSLSRYRKLKLC